MTTYLKVTKVYTDPDGNVMATVQLPDEILLPFRASDYYVSVGPLDEQMQPVDTTNTGENNKIIKRSN